MRPPREMPVKRLVQLDRLLQSGEHPLALVGSISWSLRRYAAATRIFQQAERRGERMGLKDALTQAGVRDWPFGALAKNEERLKQLGRKRAGNIYRWLLELDLSLKGTHSADDRARWALEQLVLRMAKKSAERCDFHLPRCPETAKQSEPRTNIDHPRMEASIRDDRCFIRGSGSVPPLRRDANDLVNFVANRVPSGVDLLSIRQPAVDLRSPRQARCLPHCQPASCSPSSRASGGWSAP